MKKSEAHSLTYNTAVNFLRDSGFYTKKQDEYCTSMERGDYNAARGVYACVVRMYSCDTVTAFLYFPSSTASKGCREYGSLSGLERGLNSILSRVKF